MPLTHVLESGLPALPSAPVRPTPVGRPGDMTAPDPASHAACLAQGVLEVLAGERPLAQLQSWTTRAVHVDLAQYVTASRSAGELAGSRLIISRILMSRPREDAAEVCVIVRSTTRSHALALRLDYQDTRWLCSALEFA